MLSVIVIDSDFSENAHGILMEEVSSFDLIGGLKMRGGGPTSIWALGEKESRRSESVWRHVGLSSSSFGP